MNALALALLVDRLAEQTRDGSLTWATGRGPTEGQGIEVRVDSGGVRIHPRDWDGQRPYVVEILARDQSTVLDTWTTTGGSDAGDSGVDGAIIRLYELVRGMLTDEAISGLLGDLGGTPAVQVITAQYGAGDDTVDVSEELARRVAAGQRRIAASNDLAGDPAPNVLKQLFVALDVDGRHVEMIVPEGQDLVLP